MAAAGLAGAGTLDHNGAVEIRIPCAAAWRFAAILPLALAELVGFGAIAGQTIAVDVGHSRALPGATSAHGRMEHEFNLDLARDVDAALRERGHATRLIGADGSMANLSARSTAARGADLLLSIHHDSVQPHFLEAWVWQDEVRLFSDRYAGFSLFVSRRNRATAASLRCASAIGASLRAAGFRPSLYHADRIPGESKPFADRANGVHYYDNLVVLKTAASPAVLFEAGVIVNRDEAQALAQSDTRERIAAAVAAGTANCLAARASPARAGK